MEGLCRLRFFLPVAKQFFKIEGLDLIGALGGLESRFAISGNSGWRFRWRLRTDWRHVRSRNRRLDGGR